MGAQREGVFWPQDYLADDVPQARVWTYGYDADVIGGLFRASSRDSVSQHGRDLAIRLEREVENEDPVIFVAHSLGGILVKDAIRRSETSRQRTKLIVFLGTPHRGSGVAGWGQIASNLARLALQDSHKKIVDTLEVDSEVLDNIHEEFVLAISERNIRIHTFQEGQGISGIKGFHGKIVNDFSSKLDQPKLEKVESINANHMQMARCRHRSDESYRAIAGVVKQFLKTIDPKASIALAPQTQQGGPSSTQQEADTLRASAVYCNLPPRNRRFVGRTEKLKELEARLIGSSDCQKLALVGLGGVGKTQVALRLAYTIKEQWPYCSILWVPAVSRESFELAYRTIASDCSIQLNPTEENPKETVRRYLSGKAAGRWLLVVDNADDEEILFGTAENCEGVADYLPNSEDGLTLFTTRYRQVAVSMAGKDVVDLQTMSIDEAESFLRNSLTREELLQDRAAMTELLAELTHLPLAISQAAAYLNAMQISLQEYLSLLKNTEHDTISLLSREFRDETRYKTSENSKNAIATTWLVSFKHIRRSDPVAADLLSFMSCIEHKAIPRGILPKVEPAEQMVSSLATLRAYAFITRSENGERYDMHRLVHLATKIWLREQAATEGLYKKTIAYFVEIFPIDDYDNRFTWREYFPHVFRLLENSNGLDLEARSNLCMWVGKCLRVDGRIGEAVDWLSDCCRWRRNHLLEDHPSRLLSEHELAIVYQANGQIEEAITLLKHVVTIHKSVLKEDHPDRLASQHELASVYQDNGQIEDAIALLEYIIIIQEAVLKEDHPSKLASQHELARAYQKNGQINEAITLLEHVVIIQKAVLKEDHPSRLASQHELARVYQKNGQIKDAIALLEHITIQEAVLKEDHPSRLASQHELALAQYKAGQVDKAIELLEQVVLIESRVLAEDHPDRLISQSMLSDWYAERRLGQKSIYT